MKRAIQIGGLICGLLATALGFVVAHGPSVAVVSGIAVAFSGCSPGDCAKLQAGYTKVNATIEEVRDKLDACPEPFGPTCRELKTILDEQLLPLREQFKLWLSMGGCEITFARVGGEPTMTAPELRRETKRVVAEAEELMESMD